MTVLLSISGSLTCCALDMAGNASYKSVENCSKWKDDNVTKWSPGSPGGEEKEGDRWNVLFKSFIYWLSQFGAEASNRAGNNSGEETVTAGWYNGISAVSEVREIHLTG